MYKRQVQNRSNQNPCQCVCNNLYDIEQADFLAAEAAFFYFILRSKQTNDDAEYSVREYPAPPYASVKYCITQCMTDQTDGTAYNRTKNSGEKCKYRCAGLQSCVRDETNRDCLLYTSRCV